MRHALFSRRRTPRPRRELPRPDSLLDIIGVSPTLAGFAPRVSARTHQRPSAAVRRTHRRRVRQRRTGRRRSAHGRSQVPDRGVDGGLRPAIDDRARAFPREGGRDGCRLASSSAADAWPRSPAKPTTSPPVAPGVEILVNNLGIFEPKPFELISDADWLRFFEVNVMSGVRLARLYLPAMKRANWGRIIFISSESAVQIPAEMIHYGMTKTAQL